LSTATGNVSGGVHADGCGESDSGSRCISLPQPKSGKSSSGDVLTIIKLDLEVERQRDNNGNGSSDNTDSEDDVSDVSDDVEADITTCTTEVSDSFVE
jgi:hypothetical protein